MRDVRTGTLTGLRPGSVAVPLAATLATAFNKPLLADSAGLVSFALDRIDGSMREMVTETVALAGSSVHFTPSAPLAPAARYQARVVGAMSALGDRMRTPFRWTFETYDPNPPAVTRTTPAAGPAPTHQNPTHEAAGNHDGPAVAGDGAGGCPLATLRRRLVAAPAPPASRASGPMGPGWCTCRRGMMTLAREKMRPSPFFRRGSVRTHDPGRQPAMQS